MGSRGKITPRCARKHGIVFRRCPSNTVVTFLLISILLILGASEVSSQPSFQECKIYLIASDTARDLSLNQEPEFIRFLNLVSRSYLGTTFHAYDDLPPKLKATYKTWALDENNEIDISAAMFNAQPSEEEANNLQALCDQTSEIIGNLMEETPFPSTLSTPIPASTTVPATTTAEEKPSPSSAPIPPLDYGPRDVDADGESLSPNRSEGLGQLPIQCRRGIFGSDSNKDGYMDKSEYKTFVNRLSTTAFAQVSSFDELPRIIKKNYENLSTGGNLNVYGAIPSEWDDATSDQQAFLQKLCTRTESAVAVAAKESAKSPTVSPIKKEDEDSSPKSQTPAVPTSNDEDKPTDDANPRENEGSRERLDGNSIAAIIGSILIVGLGAYMAKDKRYMWQRFRTSRFSIRGLRKNPPLVPTSGSDDISLGDRTSKSEASRTEGNTYDEEATQQQEQTSFLEDGRIGTFCLDDEDGNNDSIPLFQSEKCEKTSFDMERFVIAMPGAEKRCETDDFDQYGYDDNNSVASSSMSLYCTSELGGSGSTSKDLLNFFDKNPEGQKTGRGSTSTATTARLSEYSGAYRYTPTRRARGDHFGQIKESGSGCSDVGSNAESSRSSGVFSRGGSKTSFASNFDKSLMESTGIANVGQTQRNPRNAETSRVGNINAVVTGGSFQEEDDNDQVEKWQDEPEFPDVKLSEKSKRPFQFLKYARDETDSISSESFSFNSQSHWPGYSKRQKAKAKKPGVYPKDKGSRKGEKKVQESYKIEKSSNRDGRLSKAKSKDTLASLTSTKEEVTHEDTDDPETERSDGQDIAFDDHVETKPRTIDNNAAFNRSCFTNDFSTGTSFLELSKEESLKSNFFSESDSESLYGGPVSDTSRLLAPESPSDEDYSVLIYDLVAKVMPTERDKVQKMLDQYRGREEELVHTLQRLDVRINAQRESQVPTYASSYNASLSRASLEHKRALNLSSVVATNAELMAAAGVAGQSMAEGPDTPMVPSDAMSTTSTAKGSSVARPDLLEESSTSEDFTSGEDSTYYGEDASIMSLSMFSVLR